jgi:hypothetical protein
MQLNSTDSAPINFTLDQYNQDTSDQPFNIYINTTTPLLKNCSQYGVQCTKVQLPSDRIQNLYISKDNAINYWFRYTGVSLFNTTVTDYTTYMPNSYDYMPGDTTTSYGQVSYYSQPEIIDVMSKTIARAFCNMLSSNTNPSYNYTVSLTNDYSNTNYYKGGNLDTTFALSMASDAVLSYVEVQIRSWDNYTSTWIYPNNVISSQAQGNVSLILIAPNGLQTIIYAGPANKFYNPRQYAKPVVISFAGYKSVSGFNVQNDTQYSSFFRACSNDSFLKVNGLTSTNLSGNWTLRLVFDDLTAVWGAYNVDVKFVCSALRTSIGIPFILTPMSLSATSSNYLQLSYEENYLKNGMYLAYSPTINQMINMGDSQTLYDSVQGHYQFVFPDRIISTSNAIVDTVQSVTTYSELSNFTRVLINANGLPIQQNLIVRNNQIQQQGNIADFTLVSNSSGVIDTLEYSMELSAPYGWKLYPLIQDGDLYSLNISVQLEYKDGSLLPYYLSTNSKAIVRISFFKTYIHSNLSSYFR